MPKSIVACYVFTTIGALLHLYLLIFPPVSGNGLTTLPLVIFLLLAMGSSSMIAIGGRMRTVGMALARQRRHLGINAGIWGISHAAAKAGLSLSIQPEGLFPHLVRPEILAALIAFAILLAMLATSNDNSLRALGRKWKSLHSAGWFIPGLAMIHGLKASENFTVGMQIQHPIMLSMLLLLALLPLIAFVKTGKSSHIRKFLMAVSGAVFAIGLTFLVDAGPIVTYLQD